MLDVLDGLTVNSLHSEVTDKKTKFSFILRKKKKIGTEIWSTIH